MNMSDRTKMSCSVHVQQYFGGFEGVLLTILRFSISCWPRAPAGGCSSAQRAFLPLHYSVHLPLDARNLTTWLSIVTSQSPTCFDEWKTSAGAAINKIRSKSKQRKSVKRIWYPKKNVGKPQSAVTLNNNVFEGICSGKCDSAHELTAGIVKSTELAAFQHQKKTNCPSKPE